jgi:Amt family ammonium transporter
MNGLLSGLVANTAGCAVNSPWAAVIIGAIAGPVYLAGSAALIKVQIDDVVDAIPVHLCNGIWGLVAVGFFAAPGQLGAAYPGHTEYGVLYGGGKLMAAQLCGMLFIIGWTSAIMIPFFWLINRLGILRVNIYEEEVGLDIIHHKGNAYNFRYNSSKHALDAGVCALPLNFQSKEAKQGDGILDSMQSNQN